MSTKRFDQISTKHHLIPINNENPVKNIKNNLCTNRKKSALQVLNNNSVYSNKKSDGKSWKQVFHTPNKCTSSNLNKTYHLSEKSHDPVKLSFYYHLGCKIFENESLPSSMTCNIDMLSNFFNYNNDEKSDWFVEDHKNIMINEIKNRFEHFGELDEKHSSPPLPIMDFSDICLDF